VHNYELILFDLDGTLYDFDEFMLAGLKHAFRSLHLTRGLEQGVLIETFTYYSESLYARVKQGTLSFAEYRRARAIATFNEFALSWTEELVDEFNRSWFELALESMKPDESLRSLLEALSRNYCLGVVSNGLAGSYRKIQNLGLDDVFAPDHVFIGEEVGTSKPDPESYRLPLRRFGIPAASTVFVGDSWELDVLGPVSVGMQAVWFNPDGQPAPTAHRPLAIISSLSQLPEVIVTRHQGNP